MIRAVLGPIRLALAWKIWRVSRALGYRRGLWLNWIYRLPKPKEAPAKVWVELMGGGFLDGKQILVDDPRGGRLHVPVMGPVKIGGNFLENTTAEISKVTFEFSHKRRTTILSPEEKSVFLDVLAPSMGLSDEASGRILSLEHEIHVYREVQPPKP